MITNDFGLEHWDETDGADPLSEFRAPYSDLLSALRQATDEFDSLCHAATEKQGTIQANRVTIEAKSRTLRIEVERTVSGAGTVARQLSQLRTELAQLISRRRLVEDRDQRIAQLRSRRDEKIQHLDAVRLERFKRRSAIAETLSETLGPQIRVSVERYGQYGEYTKALTDALRGSGMRYADLVVAISQSVSPQELIRLLDERDFVTLSDITGIPKDRSARLINHLTEVGAADIVTASIDDNVRMSLLDGVDYKHVEHLSAGQRCTVILSIILQHTTRTLIIDQPEDHLDNAYIASTVIKAINSRKPHGQLIISTHNANIPVLGGADLVVEMTSDGRNGFVQVCAPLTAPTAVTAITNVMEGGRDAFRNRAQFYDGYANR